MFKLIHTIQRINNEHIIKFTKSFSYPIGISPILVLSQLKADGPQKQVDLADSLGYTKGAMTNIANKLVTLNLAKKVYDEEDRRTIRLDITPLGETALQEAQAIGQKIFIQHFEVLSEKELEFYMEIQEKLMKEIEKSDT